MATPEETVAIPEIDEGFTHAEDVLADGDDSVGAKSVDPVQSEPEPAPVTSEQVKEEDEGGEKEAEAPDLKLTLLISGAAVAVVGAIFAIVKKIKQA